MLDEPTFVDPTSDQPVSDIVIDRPQFDLTPTFEKDEVWVTSDSLMLN